MAKITSTSSDILSHQIVRIFLSRTKRGSNCLHTSVTCELIKLNQTNNKMVDQMSLAMKGLAEKLKQELLKKQTTEI